VIVIRVIVSRGIEQFSPKGIDGAGTIQPPNGENCMDKSYSLSNNPARQQYLLNLCTNREVSYWLCLTGGISNNKK
jgi:hypothetical protein